MINNINGIYKLLAHGTFDSKSKYIPTSDFIEGELTYSTDGFISVNINFKEKPVLIADNLSYSGTYTVLSSSEISHNIHICNRRSRNSSSEKRYYTLIDNVLSLSTQKDGIKDFEAIWIKT